MLELVYDVLKACSLDFTAAVFVPEASVHGLPRRPPELAADVRVDASAADTKGPRMPVLLDLVRAARGSSAPRPSAAPPQEPSANLHGDHPYTSQMTFLGERPRMERTGAVGVSGKAGPEDGGLHDTPSVPAGSPATDCARSSPPSAATGEPWTTGPRGAHGGLLSGRPPSAAAKESSLSSEPKPDTLLGGSSTGSEGRSGSLLGALPPLTGSRRGAPSLGTALPERLDAQPGVAETRTLRPDDAGDVDPDVERLRSIEARLNKLGTAPGGSLASAGPAPSGFAAVGTLQRPQSAPEPDRSSAPPAAPQGPVLEDDLLLEEDIDEDIISLEAASDHGSGSNDFELDAGDS